MALEFDSQGFLKGDPIDLGPMPGYLRDIKSDVAAIRKAIIGPGTNSTRQRVASSPAVTPNRDSSGRFVPKTAVATPTGSVRSEAALSALAESLGVTEGQKKKILSKFKSGASRAEVATPMRGSNGRFLRKNENNENPEDATKKPSPSAYRSVLGYLVGRLTAVNVGNGMEEVDPSIKAFREVAEPMQRSIEFFRGGKDSGETKWLRKIFGRLNVFHKESTVFDKAQAKVLKSIDEKTGVSGGNPSYSSSIIDKIPIVGPVIRALGKTAIGGGLLGKGGRGAAGLFKRIPVLGALLAGAGAAFDIYGSENDESLTRRDKDKAAGKSLGGWGGTLAGVAGGAMAGSVAGPVGTIVGGVVGGFMGDQAGQIIGEKFGTWVNDLREADVPGKLLSKFKQWTDGFDFGKAFELWLERTKSNFGMVGDVAKEQLNDLNNYTKANAGIDFKQLGEAWWERTSDNLSGAWQATKDAANGAVNWFGDSTTLGRTAKKAVRNLRTGGEIGNAERAMQILMDKGWSKDDAAAIAANLNNESGFDTTAKGDGGKALGIAQWHPDRQRVFEEEFGKKLADASFDEQVAFVDWELKNTHKRAGDNIRSASSVEQKAAITEQQYEISALGMRGGVQPERIADARRFSNIATASAPSVMPPKIQQPPPIAESPQIIQPLGSSQAQQFTVNIPSQDVGRDLSDRRSAHIVTGGICGA